MIVPDAIQSREVARLGETVPFNQFFEEPTRNGLTRPKAVRGAGTKMVNMGELFAVPRIKNLDMDRVPLSDAEATKYLLKAGDLLFARQSLVLEGAGQCSIFMGDLEPVTFESHIIRVRLDKKKSNPLFFFYYFRSEHGRNAIRRIVEQGAGAAGVRASDLSDIPVINLPLEDQRRIADVLGTLDDKIELNLRMAATLEEMARALFKSWFVDFDPVRAKAEGRPTGLPPDIDALFPDELVESEVGLIPQGWSIGTVGEYFKITMGQSPPGNTYNAEGNGMPFYQGKTDFGFRFPAPRMYCTAPTRIAEAGDVLISVRAPVGAINMATERCCIGRGVGSALHKTGSQSFTFHGMGTLSSYFAQFDGEGTVFGSMSKKDFESIPFIEPSLQIVAAFEHMCRPIDAKVFNAESESRALSALRDTLIPKLLSGELGALQ